MSDIAICHDNAALADIFKQFETAYRKHEDLSTASSTCIGLGCKIDETVVSGSEGWSGRFSSFNVETTVKEYARKFVWNGETVQVATLKLCEQADNRCSYKLYLYNQYYAYKMLTTSGSDGKCVSPDIVKVLGKGLVALGLYDESTVEKMTLTITQATQRIIDAAKSAVATDY